MSVKHIGTTAAAAMFGLALLASSPASAAPLGTVAAEIDAAIDSPAITVARRGPAPGAAIRRGPGPVIRRGPVVVRRGPAIIRRGPVVLRRGPGIIRGGPRIGRVARIRPGFFRPGRRLWVYPALGAGLLALTLAPGWYWGDYYDECRRWIIPCPGCAPALVDLCESY